jgi:hypothetical protein
MDWVGYGTQMSASQMPFDPGPWVPSHEMPTVPRWQEPPAPPYPPPPLPTFIGPPTLKSAAADHGQAISMGVMSIERLFPRLWPPLPVMIFFRVIAKLADGVKDGGEIGET